MPCPTIKTAIPARRYKFGEYTITLLTDISSNDKTEYLFIAAVVKDGCSEPEVYITCEPISAPTVRVRVLTEQSEHIIGEGAEWNKEQPFCDFALQGIEQMFALSDEQAVRIM